MRPFDTAKWIWLAMGERADQYAEFYDTLSYHTSETVIVHISCDSDYSLFINGKYVASSQYGDFEHYKIYDSIDVTPLLRTGNNRIVILVYHCGAPTSRYRPAPAGLIYEFVSGQAVLLASRADVLSKEAFGYRSGLQKEITSQLGFSFFYDATCKDGVCVPSAEVNKNCTFYPRPIKKARVLGRCEGHILQNDGDTHFLIDLGGEVVGFPTLELFSDIEQTVTVTWGEHLEDGCVRRVIGNRDFSYEYRTVCGKNEFTNYMLRLGCRYIEVFCEAPIDLCYMGVLPEVYEINERAVSIGSPLDRRIYDICVNTLRLCMMEHYVDCPWREQALYAFDSRNQMLFGYYAFENQNAAYARANLKLIGMDRRKDGLLSICYPSGSSLAIPSFSLYYIIAMWEYIKYTGDKTLAVEMYQKQTEVLEVFADHRREGLVTAFEGKEYWNFYDWSEFSSGKIGSLDEPIPDLVINCLFVLALDSFEATCRTIGEVFPYPSVAETLRRDIHTAFFTERGLYTMRQGREEYTVLGNALAILAGVCNEGDADAICRQIVAGNLNNCSLSTKILEYDALLMTDAARYADFILEEIRVGYKMMLDAGSDTVWETLDGAMAFRNAGSLCHGWSAIPVYIYHKLGLADYEKEKENGK